jgi:argininosuccinate lyase
VLTVAGSLASRDGVGGTAPVRVAEQLVAVGERVAADHAWANAPVMPTHPPAPARINFPPRGSTSR